MSTAKPSPDLGPAGSLDRPTPGERTPVTHSRTSPAGPGDAHTPGMPLNQFYVALGHELRVPMNRMMSMARLLFEGGLSREQQHVAREICNSGDTLLRLVNDALDFVEADAGPREPATIPFDLRLLVDETIALLRVCAADRGVSLEHRVHHEVPSLLVGDAGRVRQVLWNLGGHAIEVLQSGGLVLRVGRVHEDRDSVSLRFDLRSYRTSQMGDPGDDQDPGVRDAATESAGARTRGSGLQLTIARRLAGLIGGQVFVEGEPGALQRAWVDLTFRKQSEVPVEDVPRASREGLAGSRVLVVDPAEAMQRSMIAKLEAWGCRTSAVGQAEDALALVRAESAANDPFRFVLIERDLPRMSAEELGTMLEARRGGFHTILLAAVGRRGDTVSVRSCGFSAYLPKPIDWQELADALIEVERLAAATPAGVERPLVTRHWLAEMRRSRTRILIVEDDVVSALVTDWTLRRMGYQVRRVSSAAEMRQLHAGTSIPFDLVVLALRLPDAEGLSLVDELRAATADGRGAAIVTLGYAGTRAERERCHAAGVDAYIASPVDLAHLCELVERITRTDLPEGPEAADLAQAGGPRPSVRQRAEELGRVTFQFDVDADTGSVLPRHPNAAAAPSAGIADTVLVASLDELGAEAPKRERHDDPVAASPPETQAAREPSVLVLPNAGAGRAVPAAPPPSAHPDPPRTAPIEGAGRESVSRPEPAVSPDSERRGTRAARPALDLERLNLASMGNASLRSNLLISYVQQTRAGLARLAQAIGSREAGRTESEALQLAQVSEAVGAVACAEIFADLQRLGREQSLTGAAPVLAEASREVDRVERVTSLLGRQQPMVPPAAA